jgi:putative flippase GtrA
MTRSAAPPSKWLAAVPHSGASLALRYALFAAVATAANIAVQAAVAAAYRGPLAFWLALACGTAAGIAPKYALDKRWIFADPARGLGRHARKFALYTLMAAATTLLFWAVEFAFDRLGGAPWRYVGAVVGLAAGYFAKYRLDLKFVFGDRR